MIKTFLNTIFAICVFAFINISSVSAASFSLSPTNATFEANCRRSIEIKINASGFASNGAEVEILYNPSEITILDSNLSSPGIQILPGNAFQTYLFNDVNTSLGTIRLVAGNFTEILDSERTFGIIEFQSNIGVGNTSLQIKFDGVGNTLDSNIADFSTSQDILSGVTNGNYNFVIGPCSADTLSPDVLFSAPFNNQTNVPLNNNVFFSIVDSQSGVDISTVEIIINGVVYNASSPGVSYSGTLNNYSFVVDPISDFLSGLPSTIIVKGFDIAGNAFLEQIVFNIPNPIPTPTETDPPIVTFIDPEIYSPGVPEDGAVFLNITDLASNIDLDSIIIYINGAEYSIGDGQVVLTQNSSQNIDLRITPDIPFLISSFNQVRVIGRDTSGNWFDREMFFNLPTADVTVEQCEELGLEIPENNTDGGNIVTPCTVINQIENSVPNTIVRLLDGTSAFQGTPLEGSIVDIVTQEVGFAGLISIISAISLLLNGLYLLTIPGLIFKFFGIIFGRKNGNTLGIIVDDQNDRPVSLAVCTLSLADSEFEVERTLTDLNGRYGFFASPGKYRLTIKHADYVTFTKYVEMSDSMDSFQFDIRLTSQKFANLDSKFDLSKVYIFLKNTLKKFSNILFYFGFAFTIFANIYKVSFVNLLILAFYIITLASIFLQKRNKSFGSYVVNSSNNLKVPFAVVKVFNPSTWQLITSEITNSRGRFDIKGIKPGTYAILVAARGFNFPGTTDRNQRVKSNFYEMLLVSLTDGGNNVHISIDPTNKNYDSGKFPTPFT